MRNGATIVALSLIQLLVIAVGCYSTAAVLKIHEYPQAGVSWNPFAVFVRGSGFLLGFVSLAWAIVSAVLEQKETFLWSRRWSVLTGAALLAALVCFLFWTTTTPFFSLRLPLSAE